MVTAWIILFAVMFMSAFFTAPLLAILQGRSIDRRTNIPKLIRENYGVYHTEFEKWFNNTLPYRSELSWTGDTPQNVKDFYGACTTTSNAKDSRRVMFVRDSFGTAMMPFLASQFSEMYSPHKAGEIEWDVMQPDIVIFETVEREAFDKYIEFNFE